MSKGNLRRFLNDSSCKLALSTGDISYLNKEFTINGSPSVENSPFGKSIYLTDDNDDRIQINPELNYSEPFTIVTWINPTDLENNFNTLSHAGADGNRTFNFRVISSSGSGSDEANKLQLWVSEDGSAVNRVHSNSEVPVGEWSMVVGVFDGDKTYVYLNDVKSTDEYELSGSSLYQSTAQPYIMGYDGGSPISVGEGQIDQVLIFDRALSEQEVSDLYHASTFNYMDNLVGYWKLDDENTVKDLSGNNNSGEVNGNPTLDNNFKGGKCLDFDGVGDYVDFGSSSLDTANFAISTWINANIDSDDQLIYYHEGTGSQVNARILTDGSIRFYIDSPSEAPAYFDSGNITDSLWHHIVFQSNGTIMQTYIDGDLNNSLVDNNGGVITSTTQQVIGADIPGLRWYLNGSIDEVMIFNKALTEAQVKDIYSRTKGGRI